METVTSRDGTPIAYVRTGSGRPVVLAGGVFNDHTTLDPLGARLAPDHTVVGYDRRGRGASGDTTPYAVEREIEDLAALVDLVGGSAAVFGFSSGAVLALAAAAAGVPFSHLVLYEPPFVATDAEARSRAGRPERLAALVAAGRPDDAVELFQREHLGLSEEMIAGARRSPYWPALEKFAPSMVHDCALTTTLARPTPPMLAVATPTLILNGADTWPALRAAATALGAEVAGARHVELPGGAHHTIDPASTATAVRTFIAGG